jgi:hypothetical protein
MNQCWACWCVEGSNIVLYRGPPSFLVLDVSEEDKVSLPMRLPAGALHVAASSIFLAWVCQKSGWLARKNSSRWTCICGRWSGLVGSTPGRTGGVLAVCCSRQPQAGCRECELYWCKVLGGRWRGCILSLICTMKRCRFSQGGKTGF